MDGGSRCRAGSGMSCSSPDRSLRGLRHHKPRLMPRRAALRREAGPTGFEPVTFGSAPGRRLVTVGQAPAQTTAGLAWRGRPFRKSREGAAAQPWPIRRDRCASEPADGPTRRSEIGEVPVLLPRERSSLSRSERWPSDSCFGRKAARCMEGSAFRIASPCRAWEQRLRGATRAAPL